MKLPGLPILATAVLVVTFTPELVSPAQTPDLNKTRSVAEAQHEIVMILIKKKEFGRAAEEAGKIFQMKWPEDQEPVLLKELLILSDQFLYSSQPALAVRLLETNLPNFRTANSRAAIWKAKGYLLEKMNQHDEALGCFREAQRLESPNKKKCPSLP